MQPKLVDSHCHLDDARFAVDLESVIGRAQEAGVEWMMTIGTGDGPPDLEVAIRLAERFPCVFATVGVHPHDAAKATAESLKHLEELARHPRVLAIGEIGLDYHYDNSPRDVQREIFAAQMDIASRAGKPIVIHTREAWPDTFTALEQNWNAARGGIMHCFSGGPPEAERSLALGFHLSFAGILTYPKAVEVQQAARLTPPDRMLVETDAPYLTPSPHRGKRNEPAYVALTARRLAELRGEEFDIVAQTTSRNWVNLLRPALP
jgi:TatD DNase family protein